MTALQPRSDRGTRVATSVHDVFSVVVLGVVQQSLDSRLRERPGSSIEGFLLSPNDSLSVGVAVEVLLELCPWEGVELLDTGDGGVAEVVGLTVLEERGEDLTRTEDHTLDLLLGCELEGGVLLVHWVWDDPLEVAVTFEVLNW